MNGQLTIKKFFENSCIRFNQGIEACIYMFINTSSSFPNVSYWCLQYWLQYCITICMFFLLNQLIPQRNCNLSTPLLSCYPWMKLEYLLILLFKICSCATFLCLFFLTFVFVDFFLEAKGGVVMCWGPSNTWMCLSCLSCNKTFFHLPSNTGLFTGLFSLF